MLTHPTLDRLNALGLHGMANAFVDIEATGEAASLGHAEWLALLLEREASLRHDKRLATRLRYAKLRQQACVEDIDYRTPRGLDRPLFAKLVEGRWIDDHANLLICGPAGVGKSWLASALGHKACRDNRSVLYQRVPRLFDDLALARGDGRHPRLLRGLGRVDLLILDDWGSSRSTLVPVTTSWKSSKIAMVIVPPSSPASSPWTSGMCSLEILPMPTPCSIASSTMPIGSTLLARACAEPGNPPERPEPVTLWTCRCAWTTPRRCPHAHSKRNRNTTSSSRDSS